MKSVDCSHVPESLDAPTPSSDGCTNCVALGRSDWVHLRLCQECGNVGCCDSSPLRHATAHFHDARHPLMRSFERREDWWWCYVEEVMFLVDGAPAAPSHSDQARILQDVQ